MFGESAVNKGFGKYSSNTNGYGSGFGSVSGFGEQKKGFVFGRSAGGMSMIGDDAKQGMQSKNADPVTANGFGKASTVIWNGKSTPLVFGTVGNQQPSSMPMQGSSNFSFGRVASHTDAPAFRSSSPLFGGSSGSKSDGRGFPSVFDQKKFTPGSTSLVPEKNKFLPPSHSVASGVNGSTFSFGSKLTPIGRTNTSNDAFAFGNTSKAVAPASDFTFNGVSGTSSYVFGNSAFRSGLGFSNGGGSPSAIRQGGGGESKRYQPTHIVDNAGKKTADKLLSKSAMHDYLSKSHEELRWEDYQSSKGYKWADAVQPNKISSYTNGNNMSRTMQLILPVSEEKPTFTTPDLFNNKGFGSFTTPSPAFTKQFSANPEETFKPTANSPNCRSESTPTAWWAVPQPAQVSIPTTPIPVDRHQMPSFSSFLEHAKPNQEDAVLLGKDHLKTGQGITLPEALLDAGSTFSKPVFNQPSPVFSIMDVQLPNTGDLQPAVVANPFGINREMSLLPLHSKSSSWVQKGISSMPIISKPTPVKTSSLLTCRHLSRSRIKLPARKPLATNNDPNEPFFYSNAEFPHATNGHSWIDARENPKTWVGNPTLLSYSTNKPGITSQVNSDATSRIFSGHLQDNIEANDDNSITDDLGMLKIQNEEKLHVQNHPNTTTIISQTSEDYKTSQLPKLDSTDYYTEPNMEELAAKENTDPSFLSCVKDFVVGRHGYGHIKFIGETDIRQLDISSILTFRHREVIVYPDETTKPPVGQGLNKPAEITLLNIKVFNKMTGRQYTDGKEANKYKKMLVQKAKENGAEFISYDPVSGEWKFSVPHFCCI